MVTSLEYSLVGVNESVGPQSLQSSWLLVNWSSFTFMINQPVHFMYIRFPENFLPKSYLLTLYFHVHSETMSPIIQCDAFV
jgi:hypothetical protein